MKKITIKKGPGITMNIDRDQLVSVDQTPDGLIFKLKMGIDIMYTHMDMPLIIKEKIISSINSFDKTDLIVDLHNYNVPIKAILTQVSK